MDPFDYEFTETDSNGDPLENWVDPDDIPDHDNFDDGYDE